MPLQSAKIKGVADVVMCVDCTGSMDPCITELKTQLETFVTGLEKPATSNLKPVDWRMRIIGFRDLTCDAKPWINLEAPMVKTVTEAKCQVAALSTDSANTGGDEAESALDAIWNAATQTPWRDNCTKIVVLFSDDIALETLHKDTVAKGAVGNDVSAVKQALAERGIRLYAWAKTCPVWEQLKATPKTVFSSVSGADGLKSIDFKDLLTSLAKTVSQVADAGPSGVGAKTVAIG
jgi:hypothetical protein